MEKQDFNPYEASKEIKRIENQLWEFHLEVEKQFQEKFKETFPESIREVFSNNKPTFEMELIVWGKEYKIEWVCNSNGLDVHIFIKDIGVIEYVKLPKGYIAKLFSFRYKEKQEEMFVLQVSKS